MRQDLISNHGYLSARATADDKDDTESSEGVLIRLAPSPSPTNWVSLCHPGYENDNRIPVPDYDLCFAVVV